MIICFLHGHINMLDYINRVPNSESLRTPPAPTAPWVLPVVVSLAAAPTQPAPTGALGIHHRNERSRLSRWQGSCGRGDVWQDPLPQSPVRAGHLLVQTGVEMSTWSSASPFTRRFTSSRVLATLIPQVVK